MLPSPPLKKCMLQLGQLFELKLVFLKTTVMVHILTTRGQSPALHTGWSHSRISESYSAWTK